MDEFLVPAERHGHSVVQKIAALERRHPGRLPSAVCYNWHWYGSDGHVRHQEGLVQERFSHCVPHPMVKSLVRLAAIGTMAGVHMPGPEGMAFVNAAFDPITLGPNCMAPSPGPGHGRLNHYYQKSFEEFGIKAERGRPSTPGGLEGRGYDTFFEWEVPRFPANRNPTPPRLLARVRREVAALEAMPGIAAAARCASEAYPALSRRVHGDDIEGRFRAMRSRFHPEYRADRAMPLTLS